MKPLIVTGTSFDPYRNLAIEETLLKTSGGRRILYLWQNDNTVVIGRHQDAEAECDLEKMREDGVTLAKRISGGGAVYHDTGNLNFTFIAPRGLLSVDEDFGIISEAVKAFGIETCRTGNNDLGVSSTGAKFSGSAFYQSGPDEDSPCFHHGTILCSCNIEKMVKYLTPSAAKLERHGVKSVKARVCNLELEIAAVRESVIKVFEKHYGEADRAGEEAADSVMAEEARKRLSSQEWLFSI
ncbi:MAG: lipoate--protein ligase family protein [Clostridiales bacterium]|nr:lipoate--protein ligase family protein [Clostridiales bacterium]